MEGTLRPPLEFMDKCTNFNDGGNTLLNRKHKQKLKEIKKRGNFSICSDGTIYKFIYNPCMDRFYLKMNNKLYTIFNEERFLEAFISQKPYLSITLSNPDDKTGERIILKNQF